MIILFFEQTAIEQKMHFPVMDTDEPLSKPVNFA
jgi:hypothetical protein